MSKQKAKENIISFNHKGENETSWCKYNYYSGQVYLQINVTCSRISNSADIAKARSRKNRMHMIRKRGQ